MPRIASATEPESSRRSIGQPGLVAKKKKKNPRHMLTRAQGDEEDDRDSAIGEDEADSTASLTSSILNYRTLHGRTYHSERGNAQYW